MIIYKCPHCFHQIDKQINDYYRKKRANEVEVLANKLKNVRRELYIALSKLEHYK